MLVAIFLEQTNDAPFAGFIEAEISGVGSAVIGEGADLFFLGRADDLDLASHFLDLVVHLVVEKFHHYMMGGAARVFHVHTGQTHDLEIGADTVDNLGMVVSASSHTMIHAMFHAALAMAFMSAMTAILGHSHRQESCKSDNCKEYNQLFHDKNLLILFGWSVYGISR